MNQQAMATKEGIEFREDDDRVGNCIETIDNIVRIFFDVSNDVSDENDIDLQPILRDKVALLKEQFTVMSDPEIAQVYSSFVTVGGRVITTATSNFIQGIRLCLSQGTLLSFATTAFLPFHLRNKQDVDIFELALSRRNGFWKSHILDYPITPREELSGVIFMRKKTESNVVPIVTEVISSIDDLLKQGSYATSVVADVSSEVITIVGEGEEKALSAAGQGRVDRRERAKFARNEKEGIHKNRNIQEAYEAELEKYTSLGLFIDGQFERLKLFLLSHTPYILEVSDFLTISAALRKSIFSRDEIRIEDIQSDIAERLQDIQREIRDSKSQLLQHQINLSSIQDLLEAEIHKETRDKGLITRLRTKAARLKSKNDRIPKDIVSLEKELSELQESESTLKAQLSKTRVRKTPSIDEFKKGIYDSFRAQEFYDKPEDINPDLISNAWIEKNIVPIFYKMLGWHFEVHGINIRDIVDLRERIDGLSPTYSENVAFPDLDGFSQRIVEDFMDRLLTIIPSDYIAKIPDFGVYRIYETPPKEEKIATTEKPSNSKKRKGEKMRHDKRMQEKLDLRKTLATLQTEIESYALHWGKKRITIIKKKQSMENDLLLRKRGVNWGIANRHMSQEDLEKGQILLANELEEIQSKIDKGGLKKDVTQYHVLIEEYAKLQKKLRNIR